MIYLLLIPLIIMFAVSFINGFFGPFLKKNNSQTNGPKVSVLIAAKNEKTRISKCLETITEQDYDNFEVIVLDDESEDGTFELIDQNFTSVKVVKGKKRPEHWNGKNWACQQLSELASGEILIFTDADNWYSKSAISKTVSSINNYNLDLLSAFPELKNITFEEKLFTPIVDLILYSFLPLWLTLKSKDPSFAAANGQWLAFKKDSYQKIGGHQAVKESFVEDIELATRIKKSSFNLLTVSGSGIIFTRMYDSFRNIVKGFSKNMTQMLGNNLGANFIFLLFFLLTIVPLFFVKTFWYSIALIILWKLVHSLKFGSNFILQLIFHPFIISFLFLEYIFSLFLKSKNKVEWN